MKGKIIRVDKDFAEKMRKTIGNRARNFPKEDTRELTDRELTRMIKNTKGFEESLKDLETLPRRQK